MHHQAPLNATSPKSNSDIKIDVERKRTVTHMDTIPESTMEEIRVAALNEIADDERHHAPTPFPKNKHVVKDDEEEAPSRSTLIIAIGVGMAALGVGAYFLLRRR